MTGKVEALRRIICAVMLALILATPRADASAADNSDGLSARGNADYDAAIAAYLQGTVPKIVGGALAPEGMYPWQVSLDVAYVQDSTKAHYCGGAIHAGSWIVTAAHCLTRLKPDNIRVTFGTNKLDRSGQHAATERVVIHKGFDPDTKDNDIGLLKIRTVFSGPSVKSIQLLSPVEVPGMLVPLRNFIVTGWGATAEGGANVLSLRQVSVPFVPPAACKDPMSYGDQITDNMICAGKAGGGVDACQGDSGGPLIYLAPDGHSTRVVGIASWGKGCAEVGKYGVYTRIDKYVDWIAACESNPDSCQ